MIFRLITAKTNYTDPQEIEKLRKVGFDFYSGSFLEDHYVIVGPIDIMVESISQISSLAERFGTLLFMPDRIIIQNVDSGPAECAKIN